MTIHKNLRLSAILARIAANFKSEKSFRNAQKIIDIFIVGKKPKDLLCEEVFIKTDSNDKLRMCIYTSKAVKPDAVGLLWLHGGGYAIGAPEQELRFIRHFIKAANCVVVAPAYTRSLVAPFPAAVNDCYNALLWMKQNAQSLGIRKDQLFVGGDSAGGGLTAAVSLLARDKKEVSIAFQMPLYPMIDDRMITESSRNNTAPAWSSVSNEIAWRLYLGELFGVQSISPYAAAARSEDDSGLPPTYTFVGNIEPFFDETKNYVASLRKAGVKAELDVYDNCFHGFDTLGANTDIGRKATNMLIAKFQYAALHYFKEQP